MGQLEFVKQYVLKHIVRGAAINHSDMQYIKNLILEGCFIYATILDYFRIAEEIE